MPVSYSELAIGTSGAGVMSCSTWWTSKTYGTAVSGSSPSRLAPNIEVPQD
jgi:hypothetical protein